MKMNLVELLKEHGFGEVQNENEILRENGVTLERRWEKEERVVFSGSHMMKFAVRVFVNVNSGICYACFSRGDRTPYKDRWYDTIGKRTYNAIADTVRFAGYEM